MTREIEAIVALHRAPQQSARIAGYLAHVEQGRPEWKPGQPVSAPPARRCDGCGARSWVWEEARPGGGRWVCGAC